MKNTLKLTNPIMINDKRVDELDYDTNEITPALFCEAEARQRRAAGIAVATPIAEAAFSLHMYMGFAAILAINPGYDFADMERIHGVDTLNVMGVGRNFMLKLEESKVSTSDEQSETTQKPSTQALQSSEDGE